MPRRFAVKIDGKERVVELEIGNGAFASGVGGLRPPEPIAGGSEPSGTSPRSGDAGRSPSPSQGSDPTSIRVDGVETGIAVEQAEPGLWLLRHGSEQILAHVDGAAGKLTVELRRPGRDPAVIATEVSDARRTRIAAPARAAADGTAPVTIRSPIPGRVVKLTAKAGDRVAVGQTVVVVEAMKMENELRAPRAATIAQVHCVEGAAVEGGQDLVTLR